MVNQFKIEHFENERPGESFPPYETLSDGECNEVVARLCHRLKVERSSDMAPGVVTSLLFQSALRECQIEEASIIETDVEVAGVFDAIGADAHVFILWEEDEIDRMATADFTSNIDSIWYPAADDILLFDQSMSWIVLINHEGDVWRCESK